MHVVCVSQAKFHCAVQLASRSATSSRAGRKLDSVMEFGRELICDLLASKIAYVVEYGVNQSATRFELSRHVEIYLEPVCDRSETKSATRSVTWIA